MKNTYITVDLEEWYELDYLKNYDLSDSGVRVVPKMTGFLDLLDKYDIKATFFIVSKIADANAEMIREIAKRGHCIACHGYDHRLLYDKSCEEFREEVKKAKEIIENISGTEVNGYRSACFSLERDKLDVLIEEGYKFDSSKILFKQHPLYRNLDLTGFSDVDDLVYKNGDFFEYEIPTLEIAKYSLPISGGGYLRLFPYLLIKFLIKQYEKKHSNFIMYLHPFELTDIKLPLPEDLGAVTKFRCLVGRKNNLKKIEKIIKLLKKNNTVFDTLGNDRASRLG